jgi:hypothetical protein
MREGVDRRHRLIKARKRTASRTLFFRIRRRISDRRRVPSLKSLARISILKRRRSTIVRKSMMR